MRVAVVYFAEREKKKLKKLSDGLGRGLESQGAAVEVLAAQDLNLPLSLYQYIVLGTENVGGFGGKIPGGIPKFLKTVGKVGSKRSCAFISRGGLRKNKSLLVLMKAMEGEGMFVTNSFILGTAEEAEALGKTLNIQGKH